MTFPDNRYVVLCDICNHLIILCGYSFNGFDHKVKAVIQTAEKLQTACADYGAVMHAFHFFRNPEVNTRLLTGPSEGNESVTLSWRRWKRCDVEAACLTEYLPRHLNLSNNTQAVCLLFSFLLLSIAEVAGLKQVVTSLQTRLSSASSFKSRIGAQLWRFFSTQNILLGALLRSSS